MAEKKSLISTVIYIVGLAVLCYIIYKMPSYNLLHFEGVKQEYTVSNPNMIMYMVSTFWKGVSLLVIGYTWTVIYKKVMK
ncbi:hypothetical protein FHK07_11885 [Listeria monocytogenes]|nr:hypothetical protein [Listeria monocytogenes]EJM6842172.1 hypothetical protein [Listeria monocytogenes]